MPVEGKLTEKETAMLRRRLEYEDQLLNSRTGIVLTLNGLMAIATAMSLPVASQIITAAVIIIVNALWLVCSLDAGNYIAGLIARINESGHVPIDELVRKQLHPGRFRIGSTRFISFYIPGLLLAGWILGLLIATLDSL